MRLVKIVTCSRMEIVVSLCQGRWDVVRRVSVALLPYTALGELALEIFVRTRALMTTSNTGNAPSVISP